MSNSYVLRTDGGRRLGLGHVKRCLALAAGLTGRGVTCRFVIRHTEDTVENLIRSAGFAVEQLPEGIDLVREPAALDTLGLSGTETMILDISHRDTFREAEAAPAFFAALHRRFPTVAVIDGHLHECLVGRFDLPVDLAIIPYAAADEQEVLTRGARLLLGPKYFILDPAYLAFIGTARETTENANRILLTSGGSDPSGLTVKVLAALERIDGRKLTVRAVIGPAFAPETRSEVADAVRRSKHRITLTEQPGNLAAHMAWCDLAVSTSGLTKYELAATETPSILLSIDADHVAFNRPFDGLGSAIHLGLVEDTLTLDLTKAVTDLLDDAEGRRAMSAAGRAVLDGRGAERVADALVATNAMKRARLGDPSRLVDAGRTQR